MRYHTVLITGGAGFIGSNLAVFLKGKYPSVRIIALDNLKRRGSELNIPRLKAHGAVFVQGDIRNPEDLVFKERIDLILECSAEPSVLAGFGDNPLYIINTNLAGTVNCLEVARRHKAGIIFLSTSRVYPYDSINRIKTVEKGTRLDWASVGRHINGWSRKGISEEFTTYGPKTLYGATKLASELLLQEYISSYGIKAVINRCGVVAGPWQFGKVDQGVLTFWMLSHYFKRPLKYIGFGGGGRQVRDFLHIDDLCRLVDRQITELDRISGKVYNAGGGRQGSLSLREATGLCRGITGNAVAVGAAREQRPGDIRIYISDNSRVEADLGWRPQKKPQEILAGIFDWIRGNEKQIRAAVTL